MNPRAKLVHQWLVASTSYRIVAIARATAGYEDIFVLEIRRLDSLGNDRWEEVQRWDHSPTDSLMMIMTQSLLSRKSNDAV